MDSEPTLQQYALLYSEGEAEHSELRERRGLAAAVRKEFSQVSSYAGSCELQ